MGENKEKMSKCANTFVSFILERKKISLGAFSFLCEIVVDVTFQEKKSSRIEKNKKGLKRALARRDSWSGKLCRMDSQYWEPI